VPTVFRARLVALALLILLVGCSSDAIYGPQKYFPGSNRHSWDDCQKFIGAGPDVQVCAGYTYLQGGLDLTPQSYVVSYYVARDEYVRISVFDERGALVRKLLDQPVSAVVPGQNWPTVTWDFTDAAGIRLASGDYRVYLRAGDYVTSSDVEVP
jgi:hypothetical protein